MNENQRNEANEEATGKSEEIADTLTAISVVSKRLAEKIKKFSDGGKTDVKD